MHTHLDRGRQCQGTCRRWIFSGWAGQVWRVSPQIFFFKQKTAYEIGLGIPAEPLFRSGGKTSYDADNRPLLVMRSNLWASGYDVDGTDQTSLGQFSGRVQQTYKHSVPRFFVPEHGTMFTLALVRFPPT